LAQSKIDARIGKQVTLLVIDNKRVILAPTGPLNRDYDDVRRYFDAAKLAINEAKLSGSVNPALFLPSLSGDSRYQYALEVAFLGMCQALWQQLEAREHHGEGIEPIATIGLINASSQTVKAVNAIAAGQYAARDLCGTEPERMAPPR
ncbi:peptidase M17, partial [Pseudoalteromonas sp. S201]